MSDTPKQHDWTKPAAVAIPKGGFFPDKVEQGRYGPIFPRTPSCYGFSIIAKVIPGHEENFYEYGRNLSNGVSETPDLLASLKLHYLRWNLFEIKGDTYFQYMGIFDTDFDKYTEDAVAIFAATGRTTVFENLEGFPKDWKTNAGAFIKFMRDHQCPSFMEYGDRKSTRLNSSHVRISYAVFCLKKKKQRLAKDRAARANDGCDERTLSS